MVITFEKVSFKYIDKYLLREVNISFTDQEKIGVVGVNGTGKSTLLKLIMGLEKPVFGKITASGNMVINYLEQEPRFPLDKTIFEVIMSHSTKDHMIEEYELKSILNKLKLFNHNTIISNLSGGEKKRLALAIVLLKYCDLLLLDEPTNHLDNEMIMWLEKYLMKWKKGLILVTHDRYFLERVCNKMVEIEEGNIFSYQANYSLFLELKEERMKALEHQEKKLKSILKNELEWIRRGAQARSTKSKSRIERFNRLSEIKFSKSSEIEIKTVNTRLGNKTIELENACKSFGDKILFRDFSFSLLRSDRIGIVGDNGCGKSTLFKILMQQIPLDSGELIVGETVKIGYFSQELKLENLDKRVIDYIEEEAKYIETVEGMLSAKVLLENFLFNSDKQYSKISSLSGGEKRRLQLLRVLMTNPNILLLDEPTNDLDIYTLEILEKYLDEFYGPVLVISHDRYFLDKVCDQLFVFNNGYIYPYLGDYSTYLLQDKKIHKDIKKSAERVRTGMPTNLRNELNNCEPQIKILEGKIKDLSLLEEQHLTNYHKLLEITKQKEETQSQLNHLIERYFELLEIKESFEQ